MAGGAFFDMAGWKVNRNAWKKQRKPFRSALLFCVCYISFVVHADGTVRCDSELKLVVDF